MKLRYHLLSRISVTGGYFTPAPVLISRFRGLSWMGLGLTPVGVGLEVCVDVVVVVVVVVGVVVVVVLLLL